MQYLLLFIFGNILSWHIKVLHVTNLIENPQWKHWCPHWEKNLRTLNLFWGGYDFINLFYRRPQHCFISHIKVYLHDKKYSTKIFIKTNILHYERHTLFCKIILLKKPLNKSNSTVLWVQLCTLIYSMTLSLSLSLSLSPGVLKDSGFWIFLQDGLWDDGSIGAYAVDARNARLTSWTGEPGICFIVTLSKQRW